MSDLKPYPAYKNSGVSWLGEIPAHWDIKPGLAAYQTKQQKNIGMIESTVLSLSYGRLVIKPPEKLHGLVPASFETYQIINPGDIVIRPTDLQNDWNTLRVALAHNRGIITSAYLALRPTGLMSSEFVYYLLHTYDLKKIFYGMGSGLRQNLDWTDLKRIPIFVPPPAEQSAIVRYLDHANQRIERYIRAKRKLIALLNEQKQAIIHRAVTRGLDPNVRLKPSGVAWLGDVPEHWEIIPAKYLFREVDERSQMGNEELLSVSHITGVTPRSQKNITMFKAQSYIGSKLCRPEDLVINTMWAWMAALGVSGYWGIVSPSYGVYRLRRSGVFVSEYIDSLLRTTPYRTEYLYRSTGIRLSRLRLYPEQFLKIPILVPPVSEQENIVASFKIESEGINSAIARAEREIELIREYRTRLIADVVTGKSDVRGAAQNLSGEIAEPETPLEIENDELEELDQEAADA